LSGAYIANFDYIDRGWLKTQILKIFPHEFPRNFICALGGLAYAEATRPIYDLLVESEVIDRALRSQIEDRSVGERLVERIALAYLWGDEELDSPRLKYLFETAQVEALGNAAGWFWSIRNQQLSTEKIERILKFWDRCLSWSRTAEEPPARLLSILSRLSCYVLAITDRERNWLLAVAPYVHVLYNDDFFFEELDRLADSNAAEVGVVLKAVLDVHIPSNDYEDRLKSILGKLVECGKQEEAIVLVDRLRQIPGMIQLFKDLQRRHNRS
jgi:hypothetical protein